MSDQKHLTLPILGMTCANCVATVERNLKKADGVTSANVNLASEHAAVSYDAEKASLQDFIHLVQLAGYEIAMGEASVSINNLGDTSDVKRLEKVLLETEGVIEATQMGQDDTAALLEPWLGKDNAAAFVNIPAIIEVKVTPDLR
ncbi:MAG: cation transporter, partial [Anaerolineales bacterium]